MDEKKGIYKSWRYEIIINNIFDIFFKIWYTIKQNLIYGYEGK